ncbi:hypothetical protein HOU02_gp390 [Caulobacter phage CcrBL9]|uniref:Uncharacterized protein n=1 Tax=Caulobacter phage CcrBL9 TaxID=2283270 RepID=A0A385EE93_9CAUD|nr:hypothetical protein HOU02_gp390 [Caulobacter phage CcrBL9]AXQ69335.1 hypothetical protein CcrBL9_gp311 [Caulobacter phage CcrBL9]
MSQTKNPRRDKVYAVLYDRHCAPAEPVMVWVIWEGHGGAVIADWKAEDNTTKVRLVSLENLYYKGAFEDVLKGWAAPSVLFNQFVRKTEAAKTAREELDAEVRRLLAPGK